MPDHHIVADRSGAKVLQAASSRWGTYRWRLGKIREQFSETINAALGEKIILSKELSEA